jgi:hypothetical protein
MHANPNELKTQSIQYMEVINQLGSSLPADKYKFVQLELHRTLGVCSATNRCIGKINEALPDISNTSYDLVEFIPFYALNGDSLRMLGDKYYELLVLLNGIIRGTKPPSDIAEYIFRKLPSCIDDGQVNLQSLLDLASNKNVDACVIWAMLEDTADTPDKLTSSFKKLIRGVQAALNPKKVTQCDRELLKSFCEYLNI